MEKATIRSVNDYLRKYAELLTKEHLNPLLMPQMLLEDFKKEAFGMIAFRVGRIESEMSVDNCTAEELRKITNILKAQNNKWNSLAARFDQYRETKGLLQRDEFIRAVKAT